MMQARKGYSARATHIMVSPTKLRRIADNLRRKPYPEVVALLDTLPQKGARFLNKVIQSAAANAMVQNDNLDEEMLYIKELQINEGPRMRRIWPRARGRRDILVKRMSHISVVVDEIAGMEE